MFVIQFKPNNGDSNQYFSGIVNDTSGTFRPDQIVDSFCHAFEFYGGTKSFFVFPNKILAKKTMVKITTEEVESDSVEFIEEEFGTLSVVHIDEVVW